MLFMLLSKKDIKIAQKKLSGISQKLKDKSSLYYFGSDITRLKIIFILKSHKEICPSDLSQILGISPSAVSHQLGLLEKAGLVKKKRRGRIICYTPTPEGRFLLR